MRRILSVLTVAALMAAMMVITALPAFADKGGAPNDDACHGQIVSSLASGGITPPEAAEGSSPPRENAGEYNKDIKEYRASK